MCWAGLCQRLINILDDVGGMFDATDPESFAATLEKHFGVRRIPAARGDNNVIRLVNADGRPAARP